MGLFVLIDGGGMVVVGIILGCFGHCEGAGAGCSGLVFVRRSSVV